MGFWESINRHTGKVAAVSSIVFVGKITALCLAPHLTLMTVVTTTGLSLVAGGSIGAWLNSPDEVDVQHQEVETAAQIERDVHGATQEEAASSNKPQAELLLAEAQQQIQVLQESLRQLEQALKQSESHRMQDNLNIKKTQEQLLSRMHTLEQRVKAPGSAKDQQSLGNNNHGLFSLPRSSQPGSGALPVPTKNHFN